MTLAPAFSRAVSSGLDRQGFARIKEIQPIPNLITIQRQSFQWFLDEGLQELFAETNWYDRAGSPDAGGREVASR